MKKTPKPQWLLEQERERKAQQQFIKEAAELMQPKKAKPMQVAPTTYKLYRVEVSYSAHSLWNHLNAGMAHPKYGLPIEQTDEQLAETLSYGRGLEEIAALLEELQQKGLLRVEERKGRRFISTTTARTCGL